MEIDFFVIGRILLILISIGILLILTKIRFQKRTGNQFFIIMFIFWISVLSISIKPNLLDSVLNNSGFVNKSQFLFSVSLMIIIYLLIQMTVKTRRTNFNFNKVIRKISIDNFSKEIKNIDNNFEVLIVIVAKNEEKTIGDVIKGIKTANISELYKILIINDGSDDKTEEIARAEGVFVVNHVYNLGVGGANKTGYVASKLLNPQIIINMDADGQHNPKHIQDIIFKIKNEEADLVYCSRFSKNSKYKTTPIRNIGNKFYSKLISFLISSELTDVTSGYRGLKGEKTNNILFIAESNFAIELAIRAGKAKLKILEIPSEAKSREQGQSQFHKIEKFISYNFNAVIQILNAFLRKAPIS